MAVPVNPYLCCKHEVHVLGKNTGKHSSFISKYRSFHIPGPMGEERARQEISMCGATPVLSRAEGSSRSFTAACCYRFHSSTFLTEQSLTLWQL